jgi:cytidylate kinase
MPSVGKSTLASKLSHEFSINSIGGGDALKEIASRRGISTKGSDWWDTKSGMEFLSERFKDHSLDRQVDDLLLEKAKQGNVVITSYTLPWLAKGCYKIWLRSTEKVRSERMSRRDSITTNTALDIVRKREDENGRLYKELYNIDFGGDLSIFDLVVDTDSLNEEEVFEVISRSLKVLKEDD